MPLNLVVMRLRLVTCSALVGCAAAYQAHADDPMAACFYSDESAGWAYEAVPPAEASALSELASRSWVHFDAQLPRYWFRNSDGRVFLCVPPKPRSPVSPICGALRYSFTLAAGSWRVDPLPPVLCSDHSRPAPDIKIDSPSPNRITIGWSGRDR